MIPRLLTLSLIRTPSGREGLLLVLFRFQPLTSAPIRIPEIVLDKGYPCEEHIVTTTDYYEIHIFRVPHGPSTKPGGPPVLLSHGVFDSAGSWVLNYPGQSLPYILADAGYDVWLGNVRGNKYGDKRKGDHPGNLWAFSFDEQGKFDVPNTVDYILNATEHRKVSIIAHSQGCTQTFAAFQFHPQLAEKVNFFAALAPAGHFEHNKSVLMKLASHLHFAEILKVVGVRKFVPMTDANLRLLCLTFAADPEGVSPLLELIFGPNHGEFPFKRYGVMCHNFMGMTSVQNMIHWSQLVRSKKLRLYDYGPIENLVRYGQTEPPKYDIHATYPKDVPIAVWYGSNDLLVNEKDAEKLIDELPVPPVFKKNIPEYAHMDFILGQNAHAKIYSDLTSLLKQLVPP